MSVRKLREQKISRVGGAGGAAAAAVNGDGVLPQWQSFVSTWTAVSTAPDLGNGKLECRFLHIGKLVTVQFYFEAGSTTTFGTGAWRFSLPVQPVLSTVSSDYSAGEAYLENKAVNGFHAHARFTDVSGEWLLELLNGTTNALVANTIPFSWGNTDFWNATFTYEVAIDGGGSFLSQSFSPILDHKPTIDTPDDEFDAATLDAKWTAVSGVAGTVDQFAIIATNTPIYDLSTRPGWLLTQVRQNDGITTGSVRLRQDFTLADGDSIVIAHTLPTYIGHPSAATNNESVIEIVLNDNDSGETAGNRVVVRYIVASLEQVQVYGGLVTNLLHNIYEGSRIFYTRILRKDDGATEEYYIGLSEDGTNWNWKGASAGTGFAPGVELNNLWITHSSVAGVGAEESPIIGFFFVRQGTNNLDPWGSSGLIRLDSVPEWMTALAGRVAGETAHVDDDFFGQDSSADYTEQTVSGTAIWTIGRGVLSSVFKNQSGGASPDWSGFLKPITSPSPPMTIETHLRLFVPTLDFPSVGLGFMDGVAVGSNVAAMASVGSDFDFQAGGIAKYGGTMNDFNNSVDTVISPSQMGFNGQVMEIYMRFVWISANTWQQVVSFDGNAWYNWGSADMSFTMTPTHFGLLVSTRGQNLNFSVGYDYFRVYDADLSV